MNAPAEVAVNSEFIVIIGVTRVVDLNAASYTVRFAPHIIELLGVEGGTIGESTIPVDSLNEAPLGALHLVQSLPGLSSASGDGSLARLRFRFIGEGGSTSEIGFDSINSVLGNTEAEAIPTVWTGAEIRGISQD